MASLRKVLRALKDGTGTVLKDTFKSNHEIIRSEDDLPGEEGETHQLEDGVEYEFNGTVEIEGNIERGSGNQLKGSNWGRDIINYTGDGALFTGKSGEFFMRNLSVMAANGNVFDIEGTPTTEFLTQDCAILICDAIGTITGFRTPSFTKFSFDNFDGGLTFLGEPDKIFMESSPIRNAGENVTALTFDGDGGLDLELIDINSGFFKDFHPTANAIEVTGSPVSDFAVVRGNLSDFVLEDRLVGVGRDTVRWNFLGNSDVRNSTAAANMTKDASTTTDLGDSTDTYTKITGATSAQRAERFTHTSPNTLTYDGAKIREVELRASVTLDGVQNDFSVAWFKNQSLIDGAEQSWEGSGVGVAVNGTVFGTTTLETGDELELFIKNAEDGTNDPTIDSFQAVITT